VRRRIETGAPADAAAREQPDLIVAEEPTGGLGRVACVGVLGKNDDNASLETEVESREQDGQCGLRNASPGPFAVGGLDGEALVGGREVVRERREALAVGELASDDM
jgi:hypothetical protein